MEVASMNLGAKTMLNGVMELEERTVVGRFPEKKMNRDSLKEWTKVNFEPMVEYPPCIITLAKGWLV
jgi:hypothetical protein